MREYLGLIFAFIGDGEAPDFPRYPDFESGGELWVEAYTRACKIGRSYIELGEAILHGEPLLQDIHGNDKANIIWIQDYVTQVGQGPLSE